MYIFSKSLSGLSPRHHLVQAVPLGSYVAYLDTLQIAYQDLRHVQLNVMVIIHWP